MITKYELCEIDGYPEFISHVVDISPVVDMRMWNAKSYSFTVSLDNYKCINVFKICNDNGGDDAHQGIEHLRNELEKEALQHSPSYHCETGDSIAE